MPRLINFLFAKNYKEYKEMNTLENVSKLAKELTEQAKKGNLSKEELESVRKILEKKK